MVKRVTDHVLMMFYFVALFRPLPASDILLHPILIRSVADCVV